MAIINTVDLGDQIRSVVVDHDPALVATDLYAGSKIFSKVTGKWYLKFDDGATTNVIESLLSGFQKASSIGESSTTSRTVWSTKVTLTTPALTGSYRLGYMARLYASRGASMDARIYDVTNSVAYAYFKTYVSSTNDGVLYSGFLYLSFSNSSRRIDLQWKGVEAGGPAGSYYISDAWLEFWREPG